MSWGVLGDCDGGGSLGGPLPMASNSLMLILLPEANYPSLRKGPL